MDILSDVLNSIRLRGTVYFQLDFMAPWGMRMDAEKVAQFHIVVHGECWLHSESFDQPLRLAAGDTIVWLGSESHWLSASPDSRVDVSGKQVLSQYQNDTPLFSEGEVCTRLICGHFAFERDVNHPFLRQLPPLIHISAEERQQVAWLERTVQLIIHETGFDYPGTRVVVDRLAEVLFIQILRACMLREVVVDGTLMAVNNREIYKALQLIHAKPETNWALEDIAHEVGMSRASFAHHFRESVGVTPMRYITELRLQKARELLRDTNLPLGAVANRVGYISEPGFSRAFKREFGQNPGALRRSMANG